MSSHDHIPLPVGTRGGMKTLHSHIYQRNGYLGKQRNSYLGNGYLGNTEEWLTRKQRSGYLGNRGAIT